MRSQRTSYDALIVLATACLLLGGLSLKTFFTLLHLALISFLTIREITILLLFVIGRIKNNTFICTFQKFYSIFRNIANLAFLLVNALWRH
jgi:hypothetical protein